MGKKLKMKGEEMTASAIGAVDLGAASSASVANNSGAASRRGSVQANYAFYEDPNHFQEPGEASARGAVHGSAAPVSVTAAERAGRGGA